MSKTVPFQTIQFSISTQFKCKYSLIVKNCSISSYLVSSNSYNSNNLVQHKYAVLFNPQIGPYQVLPFRARVDLGAMAMKGCFAFPKVPTSLEPHQRIIQCHIQDTYWGGSYPAAEVQSVYSTAPTDWRERHNFYYVDCFYIVLPSTPLLNSRPRLKI